MKKVLKILGDVAVVVGCCIGVGFLSGKEAQVFFGNKLNVAIFAVAFFAITYAVREYCRQQQCATINGLSRALFGKKSTIFSVFITLCAFVCIVTVLAGVEQCISQLYYIGKLPLYAFATAVVSAILLKFKLKALKIANAVAVIMAVILLVVLLCTSRTRNTENLQVPLYQPIVYALFSVTMSLGVVTQLATDCSKQENFIASLLASTVLAILLIVLLPLCNMTLNLPTLGEISHPMLIFNTIITLLLSAVTGIVANALPVLEQLNGLTGDETLNCAVIFLVALAFSMFGFDFAVKFGYLLVSGVGAIIVLVAIIKSIKNKLKEKKTKASPA